MALRANGYLLSKVWCWALVRTSQWPLIVCCTVLWCVHSLIEVQRNGMCWWDSLCPPSYMPTSSPCLQQLTAQHQSRGMQLLSTILYLMGEFFLIPAWLDLSMLILLCPHRTITMGKPQRGSRYSQSPIFPHVKAPVSTSANDTKSLFVHSKVCMQYNSLKCTMSLTHHVAE